MLSVRSTIVREARWFLINVAILLTCLFALALAQAAWMFSTSSNGSIADGWSGNPIEQAFGWATMGVWFAAFYSPLLVFVFVPYRLLVHVFGHPRAIAVLFASALTVLAAAVVENAQPGWLLFLAIFSLGYALLLRPPGQTLGDLPPLMRGGLVGFALSCIWIVGSFAALGWAAYRASKGALGEAGAILLAGTAVPGLMLFADLFRDDVPGLNYALTALLLGAMGAGVLALARAALPRGSATA
jgi:hypothetical protein